MIQDRPIATTSTNTDASNAEIATRYHCERLDTIACTELVIFIGNDKMKVTYHHVVYNNENKGDSCPSDTIRLVLVVVGSYIFKEKFSQPASNKSTKSQISTSGSRQPDDNMLVSITLAANRGNCSGSRYET